jgi:hypothetical protein
MMGWGLASGLRSEGWDLRLILLGGMWFGVPASLIGIFGGLVFGVVLAGIEAHCGNFR